MPTSSMMTKIIFGPCAVSGELLHPLRTSNATPAANKAETVLFKFVSVAAAQSARCHRVAEIVTDFLAAQKLSSADFDPAFHWRCPRSSIVKTIDRTTPPSTRTAAKLVAQPCSHHA